MVNFKQKISNKYSEKGAKVGSNLQESTLGASGTSNLPQRKTQHRVKKTLKALCNSKLIFKGVSK